MAAALCHEAEAGFPGLVFVIASVDRFGFGHFISGSSLLANLIARIESYAKGSDSLWCSATTYAEHSHYFTRTQTDLDWSSFHDFYCAIDFQAYWPHPCFNENGGLIGFLSVYANAPREPSAQEAEFIDRWRELCELALRRHEHADAGERKAQIDALTGLPNRAAFEANFSGLEAQPFNSWAMFVIDLDNLKTVNDVFGHKAGDQLIRIAGERISQAMAPDVTFRIGGDEFLVIVRRQKWLRDLEAAASEILTSLETPAKCDSQSFIPAATIGGAVFDTEDCDAHRVYQNADFALYHAKETGRGGFVRYWKGIDTRMTRRRSAVRDVAEALEEQRIEACYQPIVQLDTRKVIGMEALCRLRTSSGKLIPASGFIDATTDAKVATELTSRMLAHITRDLEAWRERGIPFPEIVLNVSTADFYAGDLHRKLERAFGATEMPLSRMTLHVNEDVAAGSRDGIVARQIARLRRHGVRVALDDFGKGQASLTHLLEMPVDEIIIARSFVERLWPADPAMVIVQGVIDIARQLKVRVIAKGIETEVQANQLWAMGCRYGQGFAFSRPVDRETALMFLHRHGQDVAGSLPVAAPKPRMVRQRMRKQA